MLEEKEKKLVKSLNYTERDYLVWGSKVYLKKKYFELK